LLIIAALAISGCKKEEAGSEAPKTTDKGPEASKTPSDTPPADKPADPPPAEVKKTDTPEAKLERYRECWDAALTGKDDVFKGCYTDDATQEMIDGVPAMKAQGPAAIAEMVKMWRTAFPDLKMSPQVIAINGDKIAAVFLGTGTNSGDLMGMPATNKKIGFFEAQVVVLGNDGKASADRFYSDQSTMLHQLGVFESPMAPDAIDQGWGETKIAIAKNDDTEKANLDHVNKALELLNKKDLKVYGDVVADDVKFYYHGDKSKVEDKKAFLKGLKDYMDMSKDMKSEAKDAWAAGDWVVVESFSAGTVAKDLPGAKGTKGKRLESNEVHFFQLADGKIKQHHIFANNLKTAVQLGLVNPDEMMKPAAGEGGAAAPAPEGDKGEATAVDKGAKKGDAKKGDAKKEEEEGGW
jgi:steroid delta-isomerase-like uncharacterized protein